MLIFGVEDISTCTYKQRIDKPLLEIHKWENITLLNLSNFTIIIWSYKLDCTTTTIRSKIYS